MKADGKILKKIGTAVLCSLFAVSLGGCGNSGGGDPKFKEFSQLVSERQASNSAVKNNTGDKGKSSSPGLSRKGRKRRVKAEDVVIRGLSSGEVIAYGRAYFDADGRLVNIAIKEEKK